MEETVLPLAGAWQFQLDPDNVGVTKQWFKVTLDDAVTSPGTMDTNHKGKLLVCARDLPAFAPKAELDGELLNKLLPGKGQ